MTKAKHGETPRTDAVIEYPFMEDRLQRYGTAMVLADFARQLERELAEVREENEVLREQNAALNQENVAMERDLEAARRERNAAYQALRSIRYHAVHGHQDMPADVRLRKIIWRTEALVDEAERALSQPTSQAEEESKPCPRCGGTLDQDMGCRDPDCPRTNK